MWPWGHLAVGYLLYSGWLRWRGRRPTACEVLLVAFGTLLPDLVDKPLAWHLGVLESGRSLGHSVVIAALVVGLLFVFVAPRIGRPPVIAFSIGYLSHPFADLPFADLIAGEFKFVTFLLWPLLPAPTYEGPPSVIARLAAYELTPNQGFQLVLFLIAAYVWYLDGAPGYRESLTALGSVRD